VEAVDNLSGLVLKFFSIASELTRPDRVECPLQSRDGSPHTPERPSGAIDPRPDLPGVIFYSTIPNVPSFGIDPRDHVQTRNYDSKKSHPSLSFRRIF